MKQFREALLIFIIPLMFITKVIQKPIEINFSPADVALVFVGLILLADFVIDKEYRKKIIKEPLVYIFIGLVFIRGISSVYSLNSGVVALPLIGIVVANIKFILSFLYFVLGLSIMRYIDKKMVLTFIYISAQGFALVGLLSEFVFEFSWTGTNRLISLVNDPNVAGLLVVIGFIVGLQLIEESKSIIYKGIIWLSTLPLGIFLILSGSRTALLAMAVVIVGLLISYNKEPKKIIIVISIGLVLISSVFYIDDKLLDSEGYDYLISRVYYGTEGASDYRGTLRKVAVMMGDDNKLLGVGTGQYPINSAPYYDILEEVQVRKEVVTHNTFASFYAENGVMGVLFYLALFIYFIYRKRNSFSLLFLLVLFVFSQYFNVENLRFMWFSYGFFYELDFENDNLKIKWSYKKLVALFVGIILLVSLIMPKLEVPFKADGTSFNVNFEEGSALYIEMGSSNKRTLTIEVYDQENLIETYEIKNNFGYYYDNNISLNSGDYEFKLISIDDSIRINRFDIINENERKTFMKTVFNGMKVKAYENEDGAKLDYLVKNKEYESVKFDSEKSTLYEGDIKGVNFGDEIELVSTEYLENEDGTITIKHEFEVIGVIPEDYIFLYRGYPTNFKADEEFKQIAFNYQFEKPLTTLEIGDEFISEWTFNANDKTYMMFYGFYHNNSDTKKTTRPYPIYFREGFVQ